MTQSLAEKILSDLEIVQVPTALKARLEQWLAADKEFNVWFLVTTKRALADDHLMSLLEGYRESQDVVDAAWDTYRSSKDAKALEAAIDASVAKMKALRDTV